LSQRQLPTTVGCYPYHLSGPRGGRTRRTELRCITNVSQPAIAGSGKGGRFSLPFPRFSLHSLHPRFFQRCSPRTISHRMAFFPYGDGAATWPDDEFLMLLCFCPPVVFRGLARSFPGCQAVGPISKLTFPVYPIRIRYACQTVANV